MVNKKKINPDEVISLAQHLSKIPLGTDVKKGTLFFPIDKFEDANALNGVVAEDDFTTANARRMSRNFIPGMIVGKPNLEFGYADLAGASEFDLKRYLLLIPGKCALKTDEIEYLSEFECYLICDDNIAFSMTYSHA